MFLDALVVRCVMLPAVLELLGDTTWKLPRWLDQRLPHINIEGSAAHGAAEAMRVEDNRPQDRELEQVGS